MKQDSYGRWMLEGTEECPNDIKCLMCLGVCYRSGNPYGVHIFTFSRADQPMDMSGFALCDPCAIKLWEFMTPGLEKDPGYVARRDQHEAAIGHYRDMWNEAATDDSHRTWSDDGG